MIGNFGDAQLERLYNYKQMYQHKELIVHVLCIYTAAFLLVALNHLPNPDLVLVWATASAACALSINIWLNVTSAKNQRSALVAASCSLFGSAFLTMLVGNQHGLLPCIIVIFTMYSLFPFSLMWTIIVTLLLSISQVVSFMLTIRTVYHRLIIEQLLATILVHVWTHFIGIYIFTTRNRLCHAAFLNARNALSSQQDVIKQNTRMSTLLNSSLPAHVIASVQSQISTDVPKIYVEHYNQAIVIYAKIYGLQAVLNQIVIQDAARLLNEFDYRITQLVKKYNFIRIQSDIIIAVAGVPQSFDNQAAVYACQFAFELNTIFRSFCDATTADIQLKIGIGQGSLSSGIIGAQKWHYDIIGVAYDTAKQLELKAQLSSILISEEINRLIEHHFVTERVDYDCCAITSARFKFNISGPILYFASAQRRFSLVVLPQAINRVLQSSAIVNVAAAANALNNGNMCDSGIFKSGSVRRRRKRNTNSMHEKSNGFTSLSIDDDHLLLDESTTTRSSGNTKNGSILNPITMHFTDSQLEKSFQSQIDRWFIPALAINILFLIIYGLYQMLVMPRLLTTFILIIVALCMLFIILLMLYVNYFESFGQFITQTAAGHTLTSLLIIVVLFVCGTVSMFSCGSFLESQVCHEVYYSTTSFALWLLATVVFIRFSSLQLFLSIIVAILFYSIHIFGTHSDLYIQFSLKSGWHVEFDMIIAILTFALLIYLQSRRNERMIRIDYLSILKTLKETHQLERLEFLNEQIVFNALPTHIAHHYLARNDSYQHMCQSVGVLSAKFGQPSDWQGEFGFDRLNRIIFEVDQLLANYIGMEKVRTAHCIYTCAVGVLPEIVGENVNDAPYTISDLLVSLTNFAFKLKQIAHNEGLNIAIGIDCGSALSLVIGHEQPRYELVGVPCNRALQLMSYASASKDYDNKNPGCYNKETQHGQILGSEEIFLALRPRQNSTAPLLFDERNPITVAPGLIGYALSENQQLHPFQKPSLIDQQHPQNYSMSYSPQQTQQAQQSMINNEIIENHLFKKQKRKSQQYQQNCGFQSHNQRLSYPQQQQHQQMQYIPHQLSKLVGVATPITSTSAITIVSHLSSNEMNNLVENENKFEGVVHEMDQAVRVRNSMPIPPPVTNIIEQQQQQHELQQKRFTLPNSCGAFPDSTPMQLGSPSSMSSSVISETDFDEIDEYAAAKAREREYNAPPSSQMDNSALEIGTDEIFDLPTDLKALANDKRLSNYLSNECESNVNEEKNSRINSKHLAQNNPFQMFASMNSSFSSELFSIDMSVESDSEIEWITPEMIAANSDGNNNYNINSRRSRTNSGSAISPKLSIFNSNRKLSTGFNNSKFAMKQSRQNSSQLSESENLYSSSGFLPRARRRRLRPSRNGPKLPSWFNSSRTSLASQLSIARSQKGSVSALDRLNAAAWRVDKMLQELASVDGYVENRMDKFKECAPFPTTSGAGSSCALVEFGRTKFFGQRELSSACHTEYDNAESEDFYSDSELMTFDNEKIDEIKDEHLVNKANNLKLAQKLRQTLSEAEKKENNRKFNHNQLPPLAPNSVFRRFQNNGKVGGIGTAYEADIDSNCSSVVSSSMYLNSKLKLVTKVPNKNDLCKWKSVHSIGYDNEYEFASENDYYDQSECDIASESENDIKLKNEWIDVKIPSDSSAMLGAFDPTCLVTDNKSSDYYLKFAPMDADEDELDEYDDSLASTKYLEVSANGLHHNAIEVNQSSALTFSPKKHSHENKKFIDNEVLDARGQVKALSKNIRENFGDYKLASFSDID